MPAIRIKYHYNTLVLNEHGVVEGKSSLCGSTVEVIQSNGSTERYDFRGFRDYDHYSNSLIPVQFVKVWNISAFFADDYHSRPLYIGKDHYCIGVFESNEKGVYLLLDSGRPMARALDRPITNSKYRSDNVVSIHSWKTKKNG